MDVVYQPPLVTDVNATWDINRMQMGIVLVSAHFKTHYSNVLPLKTWAFLQKEIIFILMILLFRESAKTMVLVTQE